MRWVEVKELVEEESQALTNGLHDGSLSVANLCQLAGRRLF